MLPSMRTIVLFFLFIQISYAQKDDFNLQKGYVAEGYDLVSYFEQDAKKGDSKYEVQYNGGTFRFSSAKNLEIFNKNPEQYLPQYGGWCAYAMATDGEKVKIDPKTYELRDGKLYLFYNAFFNNTFESWHEEGPEKLIPEANQNWKNFQK